MAIPIRILITISTSIFQGKAQPRAPTAKMIALIMINFFLPKKSESLPLAMAPITAPTKTVVVIHSILGSSNFQ